MMPRGSGRFFISRRFLLFFVSQSLVSCGAFIQVVAVGQRLVGITNSGLLTGLSMVCAPLPGVLLSLIAGGLGDRVKARNLLLLFDLLRGGLLLLYPFCSSASALLPAMMLSGVLDVLYSPSRNKTLTALVGREELLRGNSLMNGGYGIVSLVMPALTGAAIGLVGNKTIFFACGAFYFLSALTLSGLDVRGGPPARTDSRFGDIVRGIRYAFSSAPIRRSILTLAVYDFGTVSVNIAFYAFAFDALKVTSTYWGLLLSVLYGMNVVAMLFLMRYRTVLTRFPFAAAELSLMLSALAWIFYALTQNQRAILAGAGVEGFGGALASTLLVTKMLESARQDYAARVTGVRDLCSYAAKLLGIAMTYGLMRLFDARVVFITAAAILLAGVAVRTISGAFARPVPVPKNRL